ncbi:MAG: hypothetical protein SWH54_18585 [Thermodesulfobacteriota bacterium]|nr:hypothetical protein [Thermodesulfobacteriota bacterium]
MVISSNYSLVPTVYNDHQLKPKLSANLNLYRDYCKNVFKFADTDMDHHINTYNQASMIEPLKTNHIGLLIDIYC